ncbi:MAG TPA: hypothetical protein VML55_18175, partial [Planctomycetaceae bacterium]|nr:hypothetical protein [Planctomycetaceae bacterium]
KRLAAASIARAHRGGMAGLDDVIPVLAAELERPGQHRTVKLACAHALVAVEGRAAADVLRKHAADNVEIALIVEPALAAWDDPPAREMWLERLTRPDARHQHVRLAIECLGAVREPRAEPRLRELALSSPAAPDTRLAAAQAVSRIRDSGLESTAEPLLADKSPSGLTARLVAANLLKAHRGPAAQALLIELAVDDEPAVAALGLGRLLEIDPGLVLPLAPAAIGRDDPHVRRLGAEALIARATPERIELLEPLLDDVHPDVRRYVRRELIRLAADPSLAESVIAAAMRQLDGASWRGQEQATFIVVAQQHGPAIPRLVELMESERAEVLVTAAWALRRLEARDVLAQMLVRAERVTAVYVPTPGHEQGVALEGYDQQLAQLFEAFGQMTYRPAEPLMRRFIPKANIPPAYSRSRAVWALGHLYAGNPDPALAKQLSARLADAVGMPPEFLFVRHAAAVSLGRMQAASELEVLRSFAGNKGGDPIGHACLWAIHQITGEPIPDAEPLLKGSSWFLTPLD